MSAIYDALDFLLIAEAQRPWSAGDGLRVKRVSELRKALSSERNWQAEAMQRQAEADAQARGL